MSKDIVVGLDGSSASTRALAHAVEEARSSGAQVRAVHVWHTPPWVSPPGFGYGLVPSPDELGGSAQALLDQQLEGFAKQHEVGTVTVKPVLVQGDPQRALVEAAKDASLLVLGCRGAGRVRSLLLGSVVSYALHHSSTPVMVIPDPGSPSFVVQRVVVGVDGSPASRAALRWGLDAARQHSCPLVAMYAWLIPAPPGGWPPGSSRSLKDFPQKAEEWLDHELDEVIPDRAGVRVVKEVSCGTPSAVLLDKAGPDDYLVLGTRGHGGFAGLLLGSTATQCAQHARGVAVVVHAGEDRLDG